jgi:predicted P-loop ATPase
VSKQLEVEGGPLPRGTNPAEGLDVEIAVWFQRSTLGRVGLLPKPGMVRDVLMQVARANSHDPLRDYLEALKWDGTPRLDDVLTRRYFGAEGDVEHLRCIGPKWAISAVARALKPGCKVDTVLILEGPQGLKKSTAFRMLGGGWFCDAPIDVNNKDSAALASQFWILELAELDTFRKANTEALKAFLSRNEDTYRPPYGRVNISTPRRCVIVGTTNGDDYLARPDGAAALLAGAVPRIDTSRSSGTAIRSGRRRSRATTRASRGG